MDQYNNYFDAASARLRLDREFIIINIRFPDIRTIILTLQVRVCVWIVN
jgi:hypothetical protein